MTPFKETNNLWIRLLDQTDRVMTAQDYTTFAGSVICELIRAAAST